MNKAILLWGLIIISLLACKGREERQPSKETIEKTGEEVREIQITDIEVSKVIAQPEIVFSVKLTPSSPIVGGTIKAEVLTRDNASVIYQWSKNERLLPETSDTLSTAEFKRGDKISLTVTPFDTKQKGKQVTVFTYIFNSPPQIKSSIKDSEFGNRNFTYHVKATDPDGDTLTYSLKSAPSGMTIDSSK
ncbi:MAG: hypothetical protein COS40_11200, partial [Deltaproteobacteria bacterium CG03_land_8_20_14_0_80_45_14]